ncbi:MAG: rRNA maturation RNAse YbeY, partial [Bacteroidota bacterium]|nr:rRNA maturation RNAse YbeY [Bacteroidota bacterium]
MIRFTNQTNFKLKEARLYKAWIKEVILKESFYLGELNFLFCDDPHIHKLNLEFLKHDTFTDILTFESSWGKTVN